MYLYALSYAHEYSSHLCVDVLKMGLKGLAVSTEGKYLREPLMPPSLPKNAAYPGAYKEFPK